MSSGMKRGVTAPELRPSRTFASSEQQFLRSSTYVSRLLSLTRIPRNERSSPRHFCFAAM